MKRTIKSIGGGKIVQGSITSFHTNNTGAPQLVYVNLSQANGASSIVEISNSASAIDNTNRIFQLQVGDGKRFGLPLIVVPNGEQITGQAGAASADCDISLFTVEEDSAITRKYLNELPVADTAIPLNLFNNGTRLLFNFANDNAGTTRRTKIKVNGTELYDFDATAGDTITVEMYLGPTDTISIEPDGAGVTCSIYEIPGEVNASMINQELVP